MPITVKTPQFEGPLELLLELIEKRKLLINDISLVSVTDEYIARINAMPDLPVGETAEFVALAATLLLLKSRSLLPQLVLSNDEERDIQELNYRLQLYQLIRESTRGLQNALREPYLYEGEPPQEEPLFVPDESIRLTTMLASVRALVDGFPKSLALPTVSVRKIVSIEEMIESITHRVSNAMRMSFSELAGSQTQKHDIIVSFLALLELVKQGIIRATQEDDGDITLESDTVSTPTYE